MSEFKKELLSTGLYFLGILVVTFLIITYVGQRTVVHGSSMEPTLIGTDDNDAKKTGDNLIVGTRTIILNGL